MTKRPELATEVMRTDAGLHADQARRHIGEPCFNLATRPLLTQHDCTAAIEADDVERVLADIDTDYSNCVVEIVRHSVLLVFGAPCQLRSLTGQEHGRTIPLAVIRAGKSRLCSPLYGVDVPFAGNPLEGLTTAVTEAQTGARHEVFDCARYKNFARTGNRCHPREGLLSSTGKD